MNIPMHRRHALPDFLPGRFRITRGNAHDYDLLAEFHYAAGRPATFATILAIRYSDPVFDERLAAVGVLSYPVPSCDLRDRWFGHGPMSRADRLRFANRNLRTISRVIVHPQFRSLSLSVTLVRALCDCCDTPFVEALAAMGRAHPLFTLAGFESVLPADDRKPVYFVRPVSPKGTSHAAFPISKTDRVAHSSPTG